MTSPPTCCPALTLPLHAPVRLAQPLTPLSFPDHFKPCPQSLESPQSGPAFSRHLPASAPSPEQCGASACHGTGGEREASHLLRCAPSPGRWAVGCSEYSGWQRTGGGGVLWSLTPALPSMGWFHRLWTPPCFRLSPEQCPAVHKQAASGNRSLRRPDH